MKLSPKFKIGIIIILLIALFTILNLTPAKKETKNFFYLISSPIQKALWRIGDNISDFFEMVKEIKNLKKEVDEHSFIDTLRYAWVNEELKLKIVGLLAENTKLEELKRENEVLRGALDIGLEKEFKLLLAEVIGKDISQDTLLIDLGSRDGISKDFPVINQQKVLVGKIGAIYQNHSKVILISNKESTFDAKILAPYQTEGFGAGSETETYGIVKGKGNLKLFLDLIPREKEIKEGDLVVTAPLGGIFPKGLLVGDIVKVLKSDVMAWQQAEILPAFNFKELEILFVITNFK
ncbi:MAG: rod shape-determining protein MreC [Candidatus Nealsonbacteria bacterium CG_4_8_14_3_um_filter_37_36]|uniref:Cell shape-determining protein MreC n=3 Tax=Candidatus Nealsoniibacteriota TaxID=1817911 RepID=A0A2H9N1I3_9BACT|nr:MAG: rod shape-determining protein MreC [Candidatus Nealsonbacteria bacterium CG_4_8_14_3_um_filter_37_36]